MNTTGGEKHEESVPIVLNGEVFDVRRVIEPNFRSDGRCRCAFFIGMVFGVLLWIVCRRYVIIE